MGRIKTNFVLLCNVLKEIAGFPRCSYPRSRHNSRNPLNVCRQRQELDYRRKTIKFASRAELEEKKILKFVHKTERSKKDIYRNSIDFSTGTICQTSGPLLELEVRYSGVK